VKALYKTLFENQDKIKKMIKWLEKVYSC
jgi:hypothetical protein